MKYKDSALWKEAIKTEFQSMIENKVWILMNPPQNQKIIKNEFFVLKKTRLVM